MAISNGLEEVGSQMWRCHVCGKPIDRVLLVEADDDSGYSHWFVHEKCIAELRSLRE